MGVKFIFIISLMHTLSDKVRFVQRKLKPEEAFRTKKWMVLAEHLLAQAHIFFFFVARVVICLWWCQVMVGGGGGGQESYLQQSPSAS